MNKLYPLCFTPILKPKPWGGRNLSSILGKELPTDESYGESWELVHFQTEQSVVINGPLAGKNLEGLMEQFPNDFLGNAEPWYGRFPLLLKYLDARHALSIQVHPNPKVRSVARDTVKHEAWYVLHSKPNAHLYLGWREGVRLDDIKAAIRTPHLRELLRAWPVQPGDCFYLPSGVVHALGGGIVVAEVQTPSDVTYRLYDWDRLDESGNPRKLHLQEAYKHLRINVNDKDIVRPCVHTSHELGACSRITECERFLLSRITIEPGRRDIPTALPRFRIWMVLEGAGTLAFDSGSIKALGGKTILLPACCEPTNIQVDQQLVVLEIDPVAKDRTSDR